LTSNSIVPSLKVMPLSTPIAAVQSHQAVIETQLPKELRPAVRVIVIRSAPWAIGSVDKNHTQSAILVRALLLMSVFMTLA